MKHCQFQVYCRFCRRRQFGKCQKPLCQQAEAAERGRLMRLLASKRREPK